MPASFSNQEKKQMDIAALLDLYVYMDVQSEDYETLGQAVKHILSSSEVDSDNWKRCQTILDAIAEDPSIGEIRIRSQSMCDGFDKGLLIACTFTDTEGNHYVAYRGTGDGKWIDNGDAMAHKDSQMQREALEYFDYVIENLDINGNVIVTGHSKGGNNAQYVTLASEYGYLIEKCYSFDGQGFSAKAIEYFIAIYGEEYYKSQLAKMYSVCGENDYVHDLGYVIIPEEQTYIIETPNGNDFAGYHELESMFDGTAINWGDESVEQGPVGKLAKEISERMMALPEEELDDCAVTIMGILEMTLKNEDETNIKFGTGERKQFTAEEILGFLAHGGPLIIDTLRTEEGRDALEHVLTDIAVGLAQDGNIWPAFGIIFLTGLALPEPLKNLVLATEVELINVIASIPIRAAQIIDGIQNALGRIWSFGSEVKEFFDGVCESIINTINNIGDWANKNFNPGYKYAVANSQISVNTDKLRGFEARIRSVNNRLSNLDERLDALYWRAGLLDLLTLSYSDFKIGYNWKLAKCAEYLSETASDFDEAENNIKRRL